MNKTDVTKEDFEFIVENVFKRFWGVINDDTTRIAVKAYIEGCLVCLGYETLGDKKISIVCDRMLNSPDVIDKCQLKFSIGGMVATIKGSPLFGSDTTKWTAEINE